MNTIFQYMVPIPGHRHCTGVTAQWKQAHEVHSNQMQSTTQLTLVNSDNEVVPITICH